MTDAAHGHEHERPDPPAGWAGRLLGTRDRLGWWTLPLFLVVGLLGAVLAGSLAVVHYSQRVAALERETAEARRELAGAVERVSDAADEGIETIERETAAVLDRVAAEPPVEDAATHGLVAVRVEVVDDPPDDPAGSGEEEPPPPRREERFGSGFVVITGDETYIVTSYAVVADPRRPEQAVERAEVLVVGRTVDAAVHSWHPGRDLALLRTGRIAEVSVAEWRPPDEPLGHGDRAFVAGVSPQGTLLQLPATVAAADDVAIVSDLAVPDVVRGGPLLDAQGRVVGVASSAYAPWGGPGATVPDVPVRALCERIIRCGDDDLGTG